MVNSLLGLSAPERASCPLTTSCSGKVGCNSPGKVAALSHWQPKLSVAGEGLPWPRNGDLDQNPTSPPMQSWGVRYWSTLCGSTLSLMLELLAYSDNKRRPLLIGVRFKILCSQCTPWLHPPQPWSTPAHPGFLSREEARGSFAEMAGRWPMVLHDVQDSVFSTTRKSAPPDTHKGGLRSCPQRRCPPSSPPTSPSIREQNFYPQEE